MLTPFSERLLSWYQNNARSLPWRGQADPYAIWVSEIMLQQTRVETVIPYYQRWMQRFPTLASLAAAEMDEVLSAWEGLGYYSRARLLQRAARLVMQDYGGVVPRDPQALRRLPGIGPYTAGAIASIAFGVDAAALDANIRRVLARVFNLELPARSPEGERILWDLAETHLPPGRAGDYNQAMMDLGAQVCTPRNPACPVCPLENLCQARALGVQEQRPVLAPKKAIPHYLVTAAVLERRGRVLIARRPEDSLLGGLWEFPGGKIEPGEERAAGLQREILEELGAEVAVGPELGIYRHAYTHFKVTLHAFFCRLVQGEPQPLQASELRWVRQSELPDFPMGKIDRLIVKDLERNNDHR